MSEITKSIGVSYKRTNPVPLDKSAVAKDNTDAEAILSSPTAYDGQIVITEDGNIHAKTNTSHEVLIYRNPIVSKVRSSDEFEDLVSGEGWVDPLGIKHKIPYDMSTFWSTVHYRDVDPNQYYTNAFEYSVCSKGYRFEDEKLKCPVYMYPCLLPPRREMTIKYHVTPTFVDESLKDNIVSSSSSTFPKPEPETAVCIQKTGIDLLVSGETLQSDGKSPLIILPQDLTNSTSKVALWPQVDRSVHKLGSSTLESVTGFMVLECTSNEYSPMQWEWQPLSRNDVDNVLNIPLNISISEIYINQYYLHG